MSLFHVIRYGHLIENAHQIHNIKGQLPISVANAYSIWYYGDRYTQLEEYRDLGPKWHYASDALCKKHLKQLFLNYEDDLVTCN